MQHLDRYRINHKVYYTVYNTRGQLALVTSNHALAHSIAASFAEDPESTEVVVGELDPNRRPRR